MLYQFADDSDPTFERAPAGLTHTLHQDALFSDASLGEITRKFDAGRDYFVATGAEKAGDAFRSVKEQKLTASQALERLGEGSTRILLKRPEDYDAGFKALKDALFAQIVASNPVAARSPAVRVMGSIFITSSETITPVHFDPEANYFFQIRGPKEFHVFRPGCLDDETVDAFYNKQVVDIAQVSLSACNPSDERVFHLEAGQGLYQPLNAPHWVRTGAALSISYALVFETEEMRARGKVRACNHYLRKLGLRPATTPLEGSTAGLKIAAIDTLIPMRRAIGPLVRKVVERAG